MFHEQKILAVGMILIFLGLGFFGFEYYRANRIRNWIAGENQVSPAKYKIFYSAGHFGVLDYSGHGTLYSNGFPKASWKFILLLTGTLLVCWPLFYSHWPSRKNVKPAFSQKAPDSK